MNVAASTENETRCPSCEYDLRGLSPSTIRCPECGADITPEALGRAAKDSRRTPLWSRLVFLTSPLWSAVLGGLAAVIFDSGGTGLLVFAACPLASASHLAWLDMSARGDRSARAAISNGIVLAVAYVGVLLFLASIAAMLIALLMQLV